LFQLLFFPKKTILVVIVVLVVVMAVVAVVIDVVVLIVEVVVVIVIFSFFTKIKTVRRATAIMMIRITIIKIKLLFRLDKHL